MSNNPLYNENFIKELELVKQYYLHRINESAQKGDFASVNNWADEAKFVTRLSSTYQHGGFLDYKESLL